MANHYFCVDCGIYTHHNPRINPKMTGFNLGCIDEIDIFKLENIVNDGKNHPLDKNKRMNLNFNNYKKLKKIFKF